MLESAELDEKLGLATMPGRAGCSHSKVILLTRSKAYWESTALQVT